MIGPISTFCKTCTSYRTLSIRFILFVARRFVDVAVWGLQGLLFLHCGLVGRPKSPRGSLYDCVQAIHCCMHFQHTRSFLSFSCSAVSHTDTHTPYASCCFLALHPPLIYSPLLLPTSLWHTFSLVPHTSVNTLHISWLVVFVFTFLIHILSLSLTSDAVPRLVPHASF